MGLEFAIVLAGGLVLAGSILLARSLGRRPRTAAVEAPAPAPDSTVGAFGEVVPTGVIALGADGRVAYVNGHARRLLAGMEPRDDPARHSASLDRVLRVAAADPSRPVQEDVLLGDPPRSLRIAAIATGSGVVATLCDVTDEVDFEEARRTFSAAVSHELRTPLARILGLAETLALPDIDADRADLAVQIENEVDGMRRLIDEMLLLAALDRGRLAVADGVADLAGVVRGVVADARTRRLGRGRVIRLEAPDSVEVPVAVRLCEVVVQNLVDNALLHGGAGAAVDVALSVDEGTVELVVSDDGIGIPAQHLPYVFQRFYRGEASRTGPGSGLGLALVKHIVEAHGGSVSAEPDRPVGAALRVRLPLAGA